MVKRYPYPGVHNVLSRDGKGLYITKDIPIAVIVEGIVYNILIKKGFYSDVTSTLWWARSIIPQFGIYSIASITHDWLIKNKMYTREIADKIFNEMNIQLGVKRWRRRLMYKCVRFKGSLKKYKY